MLGKYCDNVRKISPLIHNITNYVTVNDCANILIACGASPIMAEDEHEAEDITSVCGGLNINIGTVRTCTAKAMLTAGKKANALGHPVLLDPVGAGASTLRLSTVEKLLDNVKFAVIRGNISEIKSVSGIGSHDGSSDSRGVDANLSDAVTDENLAHSVTFIKQLAARLDTVIAVTGAIDIVADKKTAYVIRNGHPMMPMITGSGCMLSAMTAAYITANKDETLAATAAAVCAMGLCGQIAYDLLEKGDSFGNASYARYIIDAVYRLDGATLDKGELYEIM